MFASNWVRVRRATSVIRQPLRDRSRLVIVGWFGATCQLGQIVHLLIKIPVSWVYKSVIVSTSSQPICGLQCVFDTENGLPIMAQRAIDAAAARRQSFARRAESLVERVKILNQILEVSYQRRTAIIADYHMRSHSNGGGSNTLRRGSHCFRVLNWIRFFYIYLFELVDKSDSSVFLPTHPSSISLYILVPT